LTVDGTATARLVPTAFVDDDDEFVLEGEVFPPNVAVLSDEESAIITADRQ